MIEKISKKSKTNVKKQTIKNSLPDLSVNLVWAKKNDTNMKIIIRPAT